MVDGGDGRATEEERAQPVVLPGGEPGEASSRHGWAIAALAVLGVGLASVIVLSSGRSTEPVSPLGPTVRDALAAPAPPGLARFREAIDSLSVSLRGYQQRHADYERGRIDCDGLMKGYARKDDRLLAAAIARAGVDDPPAQVTAAFDSLMAVSADTDRMYDATGCPRP